MQDLIPRTGTEAGFTDLPFLTLDHVPQYEVINMINVQTFRRRKQQNCKISMVTCYDFWSAKILNQTDIDCLLVGDSLAVVMHGFESTVHATLEMMKLHTAAVVRGAKDKFVIADMPFLTCSKGMEKGMDAVQELMQAGASAVKIEGAGTSGGIDCPHR